MKISDSVERIDGTMAHVYVVRHGGKVVLVGAGMKSSARKIITFLEENSEKPDAVLITHYHPDHIGGLAKIVEHYNPAIYASGLEIGVISGKEKLEPAKSMLSKFVGAVSRHEPVDGVKDLDALPFEWIKVMDTHGHTPGSTSFLYEPESMLFVGDAVTVKNNATSINRQFTLDIAEAEKSREKILSMKGSTVLPGHGEPLRIQ